MSIFKKVLKIAIDSIILPVEVVKDITSDKGKNFPTSFDNTSSRFSKIKKSAKDIYEELDK